MSSTIKTTVHSFSFNLEKPADKEAWKALQAKLLATPGRGHCMHAIGNHYLPSWLGSHVPELLPVELETAHFFENQWNTAPIEGVSKDGLRVFDFALDAVYVNGYEKPHLKRGHYLDITDEMREIRRNTYTCGYCGKHEPAAKGYVFCPHCLDSAYLKESDLCLTRMLPVDQHHKPGVNRAPLTAAESAHLLPLYRQAQIHGSTERGKARIAKARKDIASEYATSIRNAAEKRDAAMWIMDRVPGFLDNWLFYTHTGRHCFGWRSKLGAEQVSALMDVISEFPFAYTIECADGRKLENHKDG